jgi:hypothetical protein
MAPHGLILSPLPPLPLNATGIAREELSQPVFSGISVLNFPELHEESIPELAFMRACSKMMQVGLSVYAIMCGSPAPRRLELS